MVRVKLQQRLLKKRLLLELWDVCHCCFDTHTCQRRQTVRCLRVHVKLTQQLTSWLRASLCENINYIGLHNTHTHFPANNHSLIPTVINYKILTSTCVCERVSVVDKFRMRPSLSIFKNQINVSPDEICSLLQANNNYIQLNPNSVQY